MKYERERNLYSSYREALSDESRKPVYKLECIATSISQEKAGSSAYWYWAQLEENGNILKLRTPISVRYEYVKLDSTLEVLFYSDSGQI